MEPWVQDIQILLLVICFSCLLPVIAMLKVLDTMFCGYIIGQVQTIGVWIEIVSCKHLMPMVIPSVALPMKMRAILF